MNKGIIYFIQPEELIDTNRYKIGCSSKNTTQRLKSYHKGSRIIFVSECNEPFKLEKYILEIFNQKFEKIAGNEYFQGNEEELKNEFIKCVLEYNNVSDISNKNIIPISNSIISKEIFKPKNKNELEQAIYLWNNNNKEAINTYGHISEWNTSNITDMSKLFYNYTFFNDNINNWNVSNVINMEALFYKCFNFNQPLYKWNVGNVRNMSEMFYECINFNQSLDNWNINNINIRDTFTMFYGCKNINYINWISRSTLLQPQKKLQEKIYNKNSKEQIKKHSQTHNEMCICVNYNKKCNKYYRCIWRKKTGKNICSRHIRDYINKNKFYKTIEDTLYYNDERYKGEHYNHNNLLF